MIREDACRLTSRPFFICPEKANLSYNGNKPMKGDGNNDISST
ncbi:hypothetical protein CHCC14821_3768 [Bacillus paralicheniformis]|nr:hypothetical protein CHCC14821_3768 [Bacillus paralicheniformis]TWM59003.1 hypothetical protein CHCC14814_1192 [Bacillus paralicheniformis]